VKLVIDGREYPAVTHETASLLHLMELKQQTREFTEDGKGLGMAGLSRLAGVTKAAQDAGAIPEDADLWSAVVVFLSRRGAGEKVTFLDAIDIPLASLQMIPEPGDEPEEEPDPTTPGPDSPATPELDASPAPTA
jgi:hypothetical protein